MNLTDIIERMAAYTGNKPDEIERILKRYHLEIKASLQQGKRVSLSGFGTFVLQYRKAKKGRVVRRNLEIIIPAHYRPAFKPARRWINNLKYQTNNQINHEQSNTHSPHSDLPGHLMDNPGNMAPGTDNSKTSN